MTQCLLVNPRSIYYSREEKDSPNIYTGLLSIASNLKANNVSVKILDMVIEDDPLSALETSLKQDKPGLVGLTVMTSQVSNAITLSRHIKNSSPGTAVIWGGIHATLFCEDVLNSGLVDYVCLGEGEYTMIELANALQGGDGGIEKVRGIAFRRASTVVRTDDRPPHDLDGLPYLDYDLLDYAKYRNRDMFRGHGESIPVNYGVVLTGVGCPFKCTFCINSNKKLFSGRYRSKSAPRIAEEIDYLIKKYKVDYFDFVDENFFTNRRRVEEFLAQVEERELKFKWFGNIRADSITEDYVNAHMLSRLKQSGCFRLGIGAESGSQKILDKLRKGTTTEDLLRSSRILSGSGIGVSYSFMIGLPEETPEDIAKTMGMIQTLRNSSPIAAIIGPQVFRPYPGGEIYDECVAKYNYRPPESMDDWEKTLDYRTGYEDLDKYGWILDKKLVKKISFYFEFINANITRAGTPATRKLILHVMRKLSLLRLRFRFWGLSFDMDLVIKYRSLSHRVPRA